MTLLCTSTREIDGTVVPVRRNGEAITKRNARNPEEVQGAMAGNDNTATFLSLFLCAYHRTTVPLLGSSYTVLYL